MSDSELNAQILAAHEAGRASELIGLYELAALRLLDNGYTQSGFFFLTQGYIHALEAGDDAVAKRCYEMLRNAGREV